MWIARGTSHGLSLLRGRLSRVPYRVLTLPAGTEIALEIKRSLGHLKDIELVGAGSQDDQRGKFAFRCHHHVPSVHAPEWLEVLNDVITTERIDFIFPAHDDVLMALSANRGDLLAKLVASPHATNLITRSKRLTYETLHDIVPVPHFFAKAEAIRDFPVFVKPDRGQGSGGARLAVSKGDLAQARADGSDLVMEFLPGKEFTVDCFSGHGRGVLFARGRSRGTIRSGIATASGPAGDQTVFRELAEKINSRLDLRGAWFFQVREDVHGTMRLLEIGPRIAGTMALHRVLGVNFPLLSLYEHAGLAPKITVNDINVSIDRPLANRFIHNLHYSSVYIDLDNTLVIRCAVNTRLVAFLFQCLNEGRRLVLFTRHGGDLSATLSRYRLAGLWDEIICLADQEDKSQHIMEPDAILIDDSPPERHSAAMRLGIATFDASMVEMLRDVRA